MTKSQEIFRNKTKIEQYAREYGVESIFLHKPILDEHWTEKDNVHWMISTNLKFDSLGEDKRGSKLRQFNARLRDLLTFPSDVIPQDLLQPLVHSISDLTDRQAAQALIDAAIPLQELTEAPLLEQLNQKLTSLLESKESSTSENIVSPPSLSQREGHKNPSLPRRKPMATEEQKETKSVSLNHETFLGEKNGFTYYCDYNPHGFYAYDSNSPDNKPVGEMELLADDDDYPGSYWLSAIEVTKSYRRRGIGTNLVDFANKTLQERAENLLFPNAEGFEEESGSLHLTSDGAELLNYCIKNKIVNQNQVAHPPGHPDYGKQDDNYDDDQIDNDRDEFDQAPLDESAPVEETVNQRSNTPFPSIEKKILRPFQEENPHQPLLSPSSASSSSSMGSSSSTSTSTGIRGQSTPKLSRGHQSPNPPSFDEAYQSIFPLVMTPEPNLGNPPSPFDSSHASSLSSTQETHTVPTNNDKPYVGVTPASTLSSMGRITQQLTQGQPTPSSDFDPQQQLSTQLMSGTRTKTPPQSSSQEIIPPSLTTDRTGEPVNNATRAPSPKPSVKRQKTDTNSYQIMK